LDLAEAQEFLQPKKRWKEEPFADVTFVSD